MNTTSGYGHRLRELDPIRTLSYELKQKYRGQVDQVDGSMIDAVRIFVGMCLKSAAEDLECYQSRTRFLEVWHSGADRLVLQP